MVNENVSTTDTSSPKKNNNRFKALAKKATWVGRLSPKSPRSPKGGENTEGNAKKPAASIRNELPPITEEATQRLLKCIHYISESGMNLEGIYRRLGGVAEQKKIMHAFDAGETWDLVKFSPHSVTASIKQILRSVYEPLLTYGNYPVILAAIENEKELRSILHTTIKSLPETNRKLLQELLLHLNEVSTIDGNLMSLDDLGASVGIHFLRGSESSDDKDYRSTRCRSTIAKILIQHADEWPYGCIREVAPPIHRKEMSKETIPSQDSLVKKSKSTRAFDRSPSDLAPQKQSNKVTIRPSRSQRVVENPCPPAPPRAFDRSPSDLTYQKESDKVTIKPSHSQRVVEKPCPTPPIHRKEMPSQDSPVKKPKPTREFEPSDLTPQKESDKVTIKPSHSQRVVEKPCPIPQKESSKETSQEFLPEIGKTAPISRKEVKKEAAPVSPLPEARIAKKITHGGNSERQKMDNDVLYDKLQPSFNAKATTLTEILTLRYQLWTHVNIQEDPNEHRPLIDGFGDGMPEDVRDDFINAVKEIRTRKDIVWITHSELWESIWVIFRSYCVHGPITMGHFLDKKLLLKLCSDCQLSKILSNAEMDAIEQRFDEQDNRMGFVEFYVFLNQVSEKCFPRTTSGPPPLKSLLCNLILPHASRSYIVADRKTKSKKSSRIPDLSHYDICIRVLDAIEPMSHLYSHYAKLCDQTSKNHTSYGVFKHVSPLSYIQVDSIVDVFNTMDICPDLVSEQQILTTCQAVVKARTVSRVPQLMEAVLPLIDKSVRSPDVLLFPEFVDCVMQLSITALSRQIFNDMYDETMDMVSVALEVWGMGDIEATHRMLGHAMA